MKLLRALLAGALVLSMLGGASAAEPDDRKAIQELLDDRAAAVLEGDRDAFMGTIRFPRSRFGRRQAASFDNFRSLPIASYELEAGWSVYGDLARPSDEKRYEGAQAVSIPVTIERYRIEGYDSDDVAQDLYLTFVERDGRWLIEGDSDLDDLGFYSARSLWDFGPVQTVETARTITVAPASQPEAAATRIGSAAEGALQRVDRYWDARWSRKVPVLVPDDPEVLRRIIQATYPVENYVAFSYWTGGLDESPGARIIVNPDGFEGASGARVFSILAHEMLHVATLGSAGPFIPRFIDEGLAQYVQYDGSPGVIAATDASADGELPEDYEFFLGDGAAVLDVYRESLSAVGFFVERWGYDDLIRFYRRLGRKRVVPGTARFHIDRTLNATVGVGLQRFEKLWADAT